MCNEYARENEVEQAIRYMEEMKYTPPISWTDGKIPNDTGPKKSIKIRDKGIVARMQGARTGIEAMTWAWTTPQGKPVFNFVSEGRDFSKSDRALVMATGFYEYTKPDDPKVKLKDQHYFTVKGSDWFWIAGIVKNGCFSMLTTAPGPDIEPYHDRQICLLRPEQGGAWLMLDRDQKKLLASPPKGTLTVRTTRRNGLPV